MPKCEQFVIIATGKYAGEGFDEPRLDTLFLAAPISWKGTLQQYAGRLHRTHAGKEDVIVYDYVDVRVKMLERMYHKRISAYSSMGYKSLSERTSPEKISAIFDSRSFLPIFEHDMQSAKHEVVICSPLLRKAQMMQIMKLLSLAQLNGVRTTIITHPVDSYKPADQPGIIALTKTISDYNIHIIVKSNVHQKFAVVDQSIVWYGSINLLSYRAAEENIMRLENMEIAEELLAAVE